MSKSYIPQTLSRTLTHTSIASSKEIDMFVDCVQYMHKGLSDFCYVKKLLEGPCRIITLIILCWIA